MRRPDRTALLVAWLMLSIVLGCPTNSDDDATADDDDTTTTDDDSADDDDDDTAGGDADGDGWSVEDGDCDDGDPDVHPGRNEQACDGIDNDCDPSTEDEPDGDGDGQTVCEDCDDTDAEVFPGQAETVCNGIDDDCDPTTLDEPDADGDDFTACADCDDGDLLVRPSFPELPCDGIDNDCDPATLDNPDDDGDGYGVCVDCDDEEPSIHPGAGEICNGLDDDCDGALLPDEVDDDYDDWMVCEGDCDDGDRYTYPGAPERCDKVDNNCNGILAVDEVDDLDGDGSVSCLDCDDLDPAVSPYLTEVCGNGLDDDCDGGADELDPDCACATLSPLFGDITITTEAAAEAFCANYNAVYGSVHLSGLALTDTDALGCLCEVSGDLTLEDATMLEVASFPVLQSVGGDVIGLFNDYLVDIDLPSIVAIGDRLTCQYCESFSSVSAPLLETVGAIDFQFTVVEHVAFPSLVDVTDEVAVRVNTGIESVQLPLLTSVGNKLEISESSLVTVDLYSLERVEQGDFHLYPSLLSLTYIGFPNLATVGGDVHISRVDGKMDQINLEHVDGSMYLSRLTPEDSRVVFHALEYVQGDLKIFNSESPAEYYFGELTEVGGDLVVGQYLYWNTGLSRMRTQVLETVAGSVAIGENDQLDTLEFPALDTIGGSLSIEDNPVLVDIGSLFSLSAIGGDLLVHDNVALDTDDINAFIDYVGPSQIAGNISVAGNAM